MHALPYKVLSFVIGSMPPDSYPVWVTSWQSHEPECHFYLVLKANEQEKKARESERRASTEKRALENASRACAERVDRVSSPTDMLDVIKV